MHQFDVAEEDDDEEKEEASHLTLQRIAYYSELLSKQCQ